MAKRRLTKQQRNRIQNHQQQLAESELGLEQQGLVTAHFGQQLVIEAQDGTINRCFSRQNLGGLVTGDQVLWRPILTESQTGIIVARLPRRSVLIRPDIYKQQRDIVANVDQIFVVIAVEPAPLLHYIDQYLMVARYVDIPCSLVVNKSDLAQTDDLLLLQKRYQSIGYSVVTASAQTKSGLDDLSQALSGQNSIFVGQSGVGKSTLLNQLVPDANAKQGEISIANQKGKHTTTTTRLYHLPQGGNLIDSPGVREFGIWHIPTEQRAAGFVEFRSFLGHCRFRGCDHLNVPGCAVKQAVDQGKISQQRYDSYCRLMLQDKGQ